MVPSVMDSPKGGTFWTTVLYSATVARKLANDRVIDTAVAEVGLTKTAAAKALRPNALNMIILVVPIFKAT
jgi:pyruvate/2-oxoglutarate/acetoin dehydrogenase E1 component